MDMQMLSPSEKVFNELMQMGSRQHTTIFGNVINCTEQGLLNAYFNNAPGREVTKLDVGRADAIADWNGDAIPFAVHWITHVCPKPWFVADGSEAMLSHCDPVMYNYGADSVMMEASNPEQYTWTIGAKCTDTCLALTSQGKVDTTALGYSPDDSDLQQWIEYDIAVVAYADHSEYTNDWEASLEWSFCTDETGCTYMGDDLANFVIDEQQYYCGSDGTTDMDTYAEYAMDALPEGGDKDVGNYLQELSSACGLYVVTYSCEDQVGNTATATQHIFVRDTIDPAIYTGYYLFSSMSGATGGVFLGGLCVAFVVGLVAHRQKRSAYIPL